ncbi:MAG TPA: 3-oxoadipate enol-lactonase [Chloroflexota bacterium]|nr:3-oxoadipate enol-lactonase [Chloroflexota bacterium]
MRARTGSFETEYVTAGSGPWLVLAHCLGGSLGVWQHQLDALARSAHVVAYDARGHGGSGHPAGEYGVSDLADDLVRLMDEVGIERASVVGLSMGGMMAQHLAADHADRVDRLVLADTTSHYEGEAVSTWQQRAATARAQGLEPLANATMERWFTAAFRQDRPDEVRRIRDIFTANDAEGYALAVGALSRFDVRPQLGRIKAPTLVITGDQDAACPPDLGRHIASSVQHGRFELLPSASHVSCVEQPDAFNRLVLDFLGA